MRKQDRNLAVSYQDDRSLKQRDPDVLMGAILGHLRRAEGVSQTGLADALSVSRQRIRDYEAGAAPLDLTVLYKIAEALNFDPRLLVEAAGGAQAISERDAQIN